MSSQMKEDERIERIIRGLLKQQDNRRCINCNSLGPQYVCTTFWTFICTNCSGIHREFTHRVKSVSMAKFTADEVNSLQAGGNERARKIFFKSWDRSRNSCPDGSNLNRLREFIKNVYVERRFTGDSIQDKPSSIIKLGSKDLCDERRSFERSTPSARDSFFERHSFESSSLGERRSFSRGGREDLYDKWSAEKQTSSSKKNLRYCIDQIRSPKYTPENVRPKSRSARFEIVDDRFREDGSGNVKKYEHYRFSRTESKRGSRSPDSRRIRNEQSPPVKAISGEQNPTVKAISGDHKVGEIKAVEPPKPKNGKVTHNAEKTGDSTNSSDSVKANAKPSQNNQVVEPIKSLIDFDTDPQSPAVTSTQPIAPSNTNGTTSSNDNVSAVDSLESLLFGLSPSFAPTEMTSLVPVINTTSNPEAPPVAEILALPAPEDFEAKVQNEQQQQQQHLHSIHNQPSAFPSRINSLTPQQSTTLVLYNQHSTSEPSPNFSSAPHQLLLSQPASASHQSSQPAFTPARDASTGNDLRSGGRKELPEDLFTSCYSPFPAASSPWQYPPPHQYNPYPRMMVSTKSRNPFDFGDESPQVSAPMYPPMLTLQGPPPNISPSPPFPPQPLPYALLASPQLASSYGMAIPAGAYFRQQLNNNMLITAHQGNHSSETGDSSFASLNPLHLSSGGITYTLHPPSSRGNPFS